MSPSLNGVNGASKDEKIIVGDNRASAVANGVSAKPGQFALKDEPVENFRRLRVVVIGAGFSGLYCAIRIPERLRNVDLCVYEKNAGLGGTWYENRYPGCQCDIPCTFMTGLEKKPLCHLPGESVLCLQRSSQHTPINIHSPLTRSGRVSTPQRRRFTNISKE